MNFRRISDHTIQCILSEEEMHEYGFRIEDLMSDQEKSRDFLERIVEKAEEEIGYEAKSGMISMQIMRMPNNDLSIIFSERDPGEGLQSMLHHLEEQIAGIVANSEGDSTDSMADTEVESEEDTTSNDLENVDKTDKDILKKKKKKERKKASAPKVYYFKKFHDIETFAVSVCISKSIPSIVYRNEEDGGYFLLIKKGKLKLEEYRLLCQQLTEFAMLAYDQPMVEDFCDEHFVKVIPKQAIRILRQIEMGE